MLRDGTGLPRNDVEAYKSFLIVAERGATESKSKAQVALAGMHPHLTSEQIATAKQEANTWLSSRKPVYPGHLR
jgi:TPR repeat protein